MSESKFSDEEIERMRRAQTRREKNIDPDKIQARKDFLASARSDGPEDFQARLLRRGLNPGSDPWKKAMEAYWAIRHGR